MRRLFFPLRGVLVALLALVAGLATVVATPAGALSPPGPPQDAVYGARVALDGEGRGLAVWSQFVAATGVRTIEAAERRRDGTWRAPFRLATSQDRSLDEVKIAMNAAGDAVVTWHRYEPTGRRLQVVTRPANGTFSAPHDLAGPDTGPGLSTVDIDDAGNALVVWGSFGGETMAVHASSRPAGGSWGAPQMLSVPGRWLGAGPVAALGPGGRALVAWTRGDVPYESVVQVAERPAGGAFGPPRSLSPSLVTPGSSAQAPAVALGPDGEGLVMWAGATGVGYSRVVRVAERPPGGNWAAPVEISVPEALVGDGYSPGGPPPPPRPLVAIDPTGSAIALWNRRTDNGGLHTLQVATRPRGGPWSAPEDVLAPPRVSAFWAGLALGASGAATALWWEGERFRSAGRAPGGRLGPAEEATLPSLLQTDMDVDAAGNPVVVFASPAPPRPPSIQAISRPAGGPWGAPVTLSTFEVPSGPEPVRPAACAIPAPARPAAAAPSRPARLTARELLVNRRIAQAALRRVTAIEALLDRGLGAEHVRDGSLCAAAFAGGVRTFGGGSDGAVPAASRLALPEPAAPRRARPGRLAPTARQLLVDQRIAQAALRRATALAARLDAGLTGADVRDGAIGTAELAAGLEIDGAAPSAVPARPAPPSSGGKVRTARRPIRASAAQLLVNRRVAQAALRRVNAVRERFALGLTGADFRPGSIGAEDLAQQLR